MEQASYRIPELLDALGVKYRKRSKKYEGMCPVHDGEHYNFNIYPDGYKIRGFWHCMSNHCEQTFSGNIIGLVRGVLSQQNHEWKIDGDKTATWEEAVKWLCDWMGVKYADIKPDHDKFDRNKFAAGIEMLTRRAETPKGICSRDRLRKFLQIPAAYFVGRDYSPALLDEYDVGLCINPKSELYNRVVVPIYDTDYKFVIGCIGRSIDPECGECKKHHAINVPCPPEWAHASHAKWRVSTHKLPNGESENFNDKNHLYNMWMAKDSILRTRCIVIVEGAGDVWRLVSAGIPNVVGLFGSDLQESQLISLECSGATTVVCLSDNDAAGENVYRQIREKCWFASHIYRPTFSGHDVGGLSEAHIVSSGLKDFIESKARK